LWREAEVDIAQQTRRVAVDRNALALLIGEPLPPETGNGSHAIEAQTFVRDLPAGLPAELLTRGNAAYARCRAALSRLT